MDFYILDIFLCKARSWLALEQDIEAQFDLRASGKEVCVCVCVCEQGLHACVRMQGSS